MSNLPLVSIIVNCYNGEKFLKNCLDSIINQSYKNWEIIFWDNLSNDKSKIMLNEYSKHPLKYFKSESFLKLYEARNLAIKKANILLKWKPKIELVAGIKDTIDSYI